MDANFEYHPVIQIRCAFLTCLYLQFKGVQWWTAANDIDQEAEWVWADVSAEFRFNHWCPRCPDNKTNEDCGELRLRSGRILMNDIQCHFLSNIMCEYDRVYN